MRKFGLKTLLQIDKKIRIGVDPGEVEVEAEEAGVGVEEIFTKTMTTTYRGACRTCTFRVAVAADAGAVEDAGITNSKIRRRLITSSRKIL